MVKVLKFYCPYCKSEISPDATECTPCGVIYGPDTDTLKSLEVEFIGSDDEDSDT